MFGRLTGGPQWVLYVAGPARPARSTGPTRPTTPTLGTTSGSSCGLCRLLKYLRDQSQTADCPRSHWLGFALISQTASLPGRCHSALRLDGFFEQATVDPVGEEQPIIQSSLLVVLKNNTVSETPSSSPSCFTSHTCSLQF